MFRTLTRPTPQTIQISILALVAGMLLGFHLLTVFALAERPASTDFLKFHASVQLWQKGQNIYDPVVDQTVEQTVEQTGDTTVGAGELSVDGPTEDVDQPLHGNLNPPFFTLLLLPLGWLSFQDAFRLWSLLSLAVGLATVWQIARRAHPSSITYPLLGSVLLLAYYPTLSTVALGQVSLFLLGFLYLIWINAQAGNERTAGILLGLAASIKIYLGLFFLFFLLLRRWRLVSWAILALFLSQLVALFVFGADTFWIYAQLFGTVTWFAEPRNASIMGFMTRLLGGSTADPLLQLPGMAFGLTYLLSGLLLAVWAGLVVRENHASTQGKSETFDLLFGLSIVVMILISPLGWIYYFVLLFIPFSTVVKMGMEQGSRWLLGLAGVTWLLSTIPTTLNFPTTPALLRIFLPAGFYLTALLLLAVLLIRLIVLALRNTGQSLS